MTSTERVWLTPQARDRLQAELSSLLAPTASDADTNPDGIVDAERRRASRIRELQELLTKAVVGQDPPNDGIAEPGMVLTIRYDDTADEETFLLGRRDAERSGPDEIEVYSPTSPLGTAITGARPGDQRSYKVPSGTTVYVTLLNAVPYGHHRTQHTSSTMAAKAPH